MLGRLADRDRLAERIAAPDPHAELELVVEAAAGPEVGALPRPAACAGRSAGRPARPTARIEHARP